MPSETRSGPRVASRVLQLAMLGLLSNPAPASAQQNPYDPSWFPRLPPMPGSVRLEPPSRSISVTPSQVLNTWIPVTTDAENGGPVDPSSATGPRGLASIGNYDVTYVDKSGVGYWDLSPLTVFFGPVHQYNRYVDPRVIYDPQSARFFMTVLETPSVDPSTCGTLPSSAYESYLRVAVSTTDHPIHSTDWLQYTFDVTRVVNIGGTFHHYCPDYPGLAVDPTCVTVVANYFEMPIPCGAENGIGIISLSKAGLLAGTATPQLTFSDGNGEYALTPVSDLWGATSGATTYLVEWPQGTTNALRLWALSDPLGARSLTFTTMVIDDHGFGYPTLTAPQCPPANGPNLGIETFSGTTQGIAQWAAGSIWFCGTGVTPDMDRTRIHYYRLAPNGYPSGTPALQETGVVDGGSGVWDFSPAIVASPAGDLGLVFTQSSASLCPQVMATLRPAGAVDFQDPVLIASSPEFYADPRNAANPAGTTMRWGDYAAASIDPTDQSFWVTHMVGGPDQTWPNYVPMSRNMHIAANLMFSDLATGWPVAGRMLRRGQTQVQGLRVAPDGQGGLIALWTDNRTRNAIDVRVVRVAAAGDIATGWTTNGTSEGMAPNTPAGSVFPDGSGGAYVVQPQLGALRADRLAANGQRVGAWPADPHLLVAPSFTTYRAAGDGVNGLFVAYSATGGIRAQRVAPDGSLAWATPPIVSTSMVQPELEPDGAGGLFVAWATSNHVFVRHVLATGSVDPAWPATGVDLGASSTPRLVQDGSGGVYVVTMAASDLHAIRLTSAGAVAPGWSGGRPVVVAPGAQSEPVAVGDGSGGLLVAWTDGRDAVTSGTDIYVTRLDAGGDLAGGWPANGRRVCGAPGGQHRSSLAADGAGGALVAWIDGRGADCSGAGCGEDVYFSRVLASGALDPSIPADGKVVSADQGDQGEPVVIRAAAGSAIVAWLDGSLVPDGDPAWLTQVLAQRIVFDATASAPGEVSIADGLSRPTPNPANISTRLDVRLSNSHPGEQVRVAVFDIAGRLVRDLYSGPADAGSRSIVWDLRTETGVRAASGLYFLRMTSPAGEFKQGLVLR